MNKITPHTPEQFRQTIEKHKASVYKLAYGYMKNRADADDVFQEVFLRYIKNQPAFEDDIHEKAWFLRVTINVCKSVWRSSWWRKTDAIDETVPAPQTHTSELLDTVMKLSPKLIAAVYLYYYEDYPIREVAQILNISETAVQTRLARAREKLAVLLKEDDCKYGKNIL